MEKSIWSRNGIKSFDEQSGNVQCRILIVGGGLCGLLCALELIENGVGGSDIVLIDSYRVFSGTSQHTTGKLTSQHGLIYNKIDRAFGIEYARQYANANENAIDRAFAIAKQLNIPDAIQSSNAFVYAQNEFERKKLEKECAIASKCGINCDVVSTTELPFKITGALKFKNQAAIMPEIFANSIVDYITEKGCTIYENTTALAIKKNVVTTDKGKIFAEKTVISTRFPFVDKRGLYFFKLYQQRSYLLALDGAQRLRDYYIGANENALTFRQVGSKLILGGSSSRSGDRNSSHFYELIGKAAELFRDCEVTEKWSAEDCMTHDHIPYIGINHSIPDTYIATGFNKWGISSSFAAAEVITDLILHGFSEYSSVFSPKRDLLRGGKKSLFANAAEISADYLKSVDVPKTEIKDIKKGCGCIASDGKKKVGAYRDENGAFHLIAPYCTHMKCQLRWNKEEHCWDCPCHGSRFSISGKVISGPAMKSVECSDVQQSADN